MGEGIIDRLKDAKSGKARKEVLEEVGRLSKEKHECELRNQQLEQQVAGLNGLLDEKDRRITELESKNKAQSRSISEKDSELSRLKLDLEYLKKKSDGYRTEMKNARKDTTKLQKGFRIMKKIAFLPKPAEDDE